MAAKKKPQGEKNPLAHVFMMLLAVIAFMPHQAGVGVFPPLEDLGEGKLPNLDCGRDAARDNFIELLAPRFLSLADLVTPYFYELSFLVLVYRGR
jgi:hypothetical protein